jgi:hypothetical protein
MTEFDDWARTVSDVRSESTARGENHALLNGPSEWRLMPWALMVNWDHPARRRLLTTTAVIFYLGRVASALCFAPHAFDWGSHTAEARLDDVAQWLQLDLIRSRHQRFRPVHDGIHRA